VRADGQVDVAESAFELADGIQGEVVVGVSANEEMIVGVVDGGDIVLHHSGDDGVFMPEGDENRDALFGGNRLPWPLNRAPGRGSVTSH
jgi:hypothetical protein